MDNIRTCLWMDGQGEAAADFYVSLFENSEVESKFQPDENSPALMVNFNLDGVPYQIINGGPTYTLSPAASISVSTPDQEETDRLWNALVSAGGQESQCGWCVDRYGLSWQIVPRQLIGFLTGSDRDGAARAQAAMLAMNKIDISEIEAAYKRR